jgi:NADH-quinone oxidoreductase subunit J
MNVGLIVFLILAFIAVAAAVAMLVSRNTIYSALFLVLNFITVATLYLILGAPLIALAQITVYAGAIMVLFLFVIMLLGADKFSLGEPLKNQRWLGLIAGAAFLVEAVILLAFRSGLTQQVGTTTIDTSPAAIGMELFGKFALPFEITSVILLVAVIGAVTLTQIDPVRRVSTKPVEKDKK